MALDPGQRYIVEVLCSGNNGRSPIAETIGNHSVSSQHDLVGKIQVVSSGVNVDAPMTFERAQRFIRLADKAQREDSVMVLDALQMRFIGLFLENPQQESYSSNEVYRTEVNTIAQISRTVLQVMDATLRNAVLGELGLRFQGEKRQTVARPDVHLVLGMDRAVTERARQIYEENYVPVYSLMEYVGLEHHVTDGIEDISLRTYQVMRDFLKDGMTKALDRFAKEVRLRS